MQQYPKFKYHASERPRIVHSAEAEAKLGQGWHDTPAAFGVETCPGKTPDEAIAARRIAPKSGPVKPEAVKPEAAKTERAERMERPERSEKKAAGGR